MGRSATTQLADLVEITPGDEVLDAGSGIGGTARYVAGRSRCHVVAVDLTNQYEQVFDTSSRMQHRRQSGHHLRERVHDETKNPSSVTSETPPTAASDNGGYLRATTVWHVELNG